MRKQSSVAQNQNSDTSGEIKNKPKGVVKPKPKPKQTQKKTVNSSNNQKQPTKLN